MNVIWGVLKRLVFVSFFLQFVLLFSTRFLFVLAKCQVDYWWLNGYYYCFFFGFFFYENKTKRLLEKY
ncbi:hypothetical protein Hanom_Chr07g00599111 [Helianthus anomalus]